MIERHEWIDLLNHLASGGTATAYYVAGSHSEIISVHFNRHELGPRSRDVLWHDPLFIVDPPRSDWSADVRISECGRAFLRGENGKEFVAKHGLGRFDVKLLKNRRFMMDAERRQRQAEAKRRYDRKHAARVREQRNRNKKKRRMDEVAANG